MEGDVELHTFITFGYTSTFLIHSFLLAVNAALLSSSAFNALLNEAVPLSLLDLLLHDHHDQHDIINHHHPDVDGIYDQRHIVQPSLYSARPVYPFITRMYEHVLRLHLLLDMKIIILSPAPYYYYLSIYSCGGCSRTILYVAL